MRTITTHEQQLLGRILRRIDSKLSYSATVGENGDVDVRITSGKLATTTRFTAETLEATSDDVMEFEALRRKIKRVCDRMQAPPPPAKTPRAEIRKDLSYTHSRGGGNFRR